MAQLPTSIVKVIEVVGSSEHSFSDAVRVAVRIASQSIRHITGVEVLHSTADVNASGELSLYKVTCKIAFVVEAHLVDVAGLGNEAPTGAELTLGGVTTSQDLAVGGGPDERVP